MLDIKIALVSSLPSEDEYLAFHQKLTKTAREKYDLTISLLKNGEFIYHLSEKESTLYYEGKPFDPKDFALVLTRLAIRAGHGGDHYVLREFEHAGVPLINPLSALLKAKDKLHTLQTLAHLGLPITPTAVVRKREEIDFALSLLGRAPYIVKNTFGSGGQAVLQASTASQVKAIFDYLWQLDRNEILLLQPYLGWESAKDVRAIYFHHKLWCAMVRSACPGEFRANVKLGATTCVTELTQEEERICRAASQQSGLLLTGIDFLRTEEGPKILEVNGCPGFNGIAAAYALEKRDLVEEFICLLLEYLKQKGVPGAL